MNSCASNENSRIRVINRVGAKSEVKFGHGIAYRAINMEEVTRILETNKEIKMVMLEQIDPGDEEAVREFVEHYQVSVVAYCRNAIIRGRATKAGIKVVTTEEELYDYINKVAGTSINHKVEWKNEGKKADFADLIKQGESAVEIEKINNDKTLNEIDRLKSINDKLEAENNELRVKNERILADNGRLTDRINGYSINEGIMELKLAETNKALKAAEEELGALSKELKASEQKAEVLKVLEQGLNNKIKMLEGHIEMTGTEMEELTKEIECRNNTIDELTEDSRQSRESLKNIKLEKFKVDAECRILKSSLESSEELIQQLEDKIVGVRESCTEKEISMNSKISELTRENQRLLDINENIKAKLEVVGSIPVEQGSDEIDINYIGSAKIINVFGLGGYGITTTAVSVARKLSKNKVLIIDLDIRSPKVNKILGKEALIEELKGIEVKAEKSGLGALMSKGPEYVIANKQLVIQKCLETRTGCLDYMSGIYTEIDEPRIGVYLPRFLNYVGKGYDYIVIDCGKIGQSSTQDKFIRAVSKYAEGNIVVTNNDKIDVRATIMSINSNKIDEGKTVCLLNFSKTTALEQAVKSALKNYKIVMMPWDIEMYGKNKTFDKVNILKDRLSSIIEAIE